MKPILYNKCTAHEEIYKSSKCMRKSTPALA
nr:MAG TPA: hypothetical protein [Caudoviricetes sp.]